MQHECIGSLSKSNINQAFVHINQELKDTFALQNTTDNHFSETTELEREKIV
jgi:hypothetical protein